MGDVFISYARKDRKFADQIQKIISDAGFSVWWDNDLLAGQNFTDQIDKSLESAKVVLSILSRETSNSPWVQNELAFAAANGMPIIPVLVGGADASDLPVALKEIQALVIDDEIGLADSTSLVKGVERLLARGSSSEPTREALNKFSEATADIARSASHAPIRKEGTPPSNSIFVVHGHDEEMLENVIHELNNLNVDAVVMQRVRTADDHLFAKFKAIADDADHAIVLISGDDVGAAYREFEHPVGGNARLEFRARQNVILELGYFYGKLGEENVFVFQKPPPQSQLVVSKFEEPSDLSGKVFEAFDENWKIVLRERLLSAGFNLAS